MFKEVIALPLIGRNLGAQRKGLSHTSHLTLLLSESPSPFSKNPPLINNNPSLSREDVPPYHRASQNTTKEITQGVKAFNIHSR
jgi:hypothetical protein